MTDEVLNSDSEDESEIYAAKLLEVMVLQCNGKIDNCLPSFVELVLNRLTRTVMTSELRTMLLQVLIAILYCNPVLLFMILDKLQEPVPNASITQHFIKQWIHDTDCFMGSDQYTGVGSEAEYLLTDFDNGSNYSNNLAVEYLDYRVRF